MLHARSIDLLELLVGFVNFEYTLPLMPDYDMFVPVLSETFTWELSLSIQPPEMLQVYVNHHHESPCVFILLHVMTT
jgi:hypothetical protein